MEKHSKGFTIWFTGLPSSGKSTLALQLRDHFVDQGYSPIILDGDEVRQRLSKDLGFSKEDRDENIRRISYVARLITESGGIAIACAISPYRSARDQARAEIGYFVEVYVVCPVEVCIERDVKGLYAKALRGEIGVFTGVSDPYEPPNEPEVSVCTDRQTPDQSLGRILARLATLGYIPAEWPAQPVAIPSAGRLDS